MNVLLWPKNDDYIILANTNLKNQTFSIFIHDFMKYKLVNLIQKNTKFCQNLIFFFFFWQQNIFNHFEC